MLKVTLGSALVLIGMLVQTQTPVWAQTEPKPVPANHQKFDLTKLRREAIAKH
jgi:hypothetical protein